MNLVVVAIWGAVLLMCVLVVVAVGCALVVSGRAEDESGDR